jgi:hypothetical protein
LCGRKRLSPRARVDSELLENACGHGALERIAKRLAPLRKSRAHHPLEGSR